MSYKPESSVDNDPDRYFRQVEHHFGVHRGGPLMLSPRDWQLVQRWHDRGIPLPVVLEGINRAFDAHGASADRSDRINSLRYCRQHVERAFQQYRERLAAEGTDYRDDPWAPAAEHLEAAAQACLTAASAGHDAARAPLRAAAEALTELARQTRAGDLRVRQIDERALEIEQSVRQACAGIPGPDPCLPAFSPWA